MRFIFPSVLFLFITCFAYAQSFVQKGPSFLTDSIGLYIQQGLRDWNLPGLAALYGIFSVKFYSSGTKVNSPITWQHPFVEYDPHTFTKEKD